MAKRKNYTAEQIIMKLREAEVLLGQGKSLKFSLIDHAIYVGVRLYFRAVEVQFLSPYQPTSKEKS